MCDCADHCVQSSRVAPRLGWASGVFCRTLPGIATWSGSPPPPPRRATRSSPPMAATSECGSCIATCSSSSSSGSVPKASPSSRCSSPPSVASCGIARVISVASPSTQSCLCYSPPSVGWSASTSPASTSLRITSTRPTPVITLSQQICPGADTLSGRTPWET